MIYNSLNRVSIFIKISLIICYALNITALKAQGKNHFSFGSVSKEYFKKKIPEIFEKRDVLILYDSASVQFSGIKDQFTIITTSYQRRLIAEKEAKDEGTVVIDRFGGEDFKLYVPMCIVEAYIHKLDEDDIVISRKLDATDIFITPSNIKIIFPRISEGSIIEYKIFLEEPASKYLFRWNFQNQYATFRSACHIEIPEYFKVAARTKGSYEIKTSILKTAPYSSPKNQSTFFKQLGSPPEIIVKCSDYSLENIPAFTKEAFVKNPSDMIPAVNFDLYELSINKYYEKFIDDWNVFAKKFLENDLFIFTSTRRERIKDNYIPKMDESWNDFEKFNFLVRHLKENIEWNGQYEYMPQNPVANTINSKKGSSADINLVLLGFLQSLGYEAHPVIISPRGNGSLNLSYPDLRQLSQMVVGIRMGEGWVFRDAGNKYLRDNLLPLSAYNNEAFIPLSEGSIFAELNADLIQCQEKVHHEIVVIDKEVSIKATLQPDYFTSAQIRESLAGNSSKDKLMEWINRNSKFPVDSAKLIELENPNEDLKIEIFAHQDLSDKGNELEVNPFLIGIIKTNPFDKTFRVNNIEFNYALNELITSTITVEGDYKKISFPTKTLQKFDEGALIFHYESNQTNNKINCMSRRVIKTTTYNKNEHLKLKNLFADIIKKQNENLIIYR